MQSCEIASARPEDLPGIVEIYAHYVTASVATFEEVVPSAADLRRKLDDLGERGLPFLVAKDGDRVLGYAHASPWRPKPAYRRSVEDSIYLAPEATGRGLGKALLDRLLRECRGYVVVAVIATGGADEGAASVALHRSFGFQDAGRLRNVGYKHDRWLDTVLMQLDLRDQ
jgi:L-amino acid N-acyltransferase YncA